MLQHAATQNSRGHRLRPSYMLSDLPLNQVCSSFCPLRPSGGRPMSWVVSEPILITEKALTPSVLCYPGLSLHKDTGLVQVPWLLLQPTFCNGSGVGRFLAIISGTLGMRRGSGKGLGSSHIPASPAVSSIVLSGKLWNGKL